MIVNFGKAINLIWEGEKGSEADRNLGPEDFHGWSAEKLGRRGRKEESAANDGKPTRL